MNETFLRSHMYMLRVNIITKHGSALHIVFLLFMFCRGEDSGAVRCCMFAFLRIQIEMRIWFDTNSWICCLQSTDLDAAI